MCFINDNALALQQLYACSAIIRHNFLQQQCTNFCNNNALALPMKFSTPVSLPSEAIRLTPQSRVMFIGSCFADHIGKHMAACLPPSQVCINPHGPLYNPVSIRNTLVTYLPEAIAAPVHPDGFFQTQDGEWRHWEYSTQFTASSRQALEAQLMADWERTKNLFAQLDVLFITFSSDHAYWLEEGKFAHNCVANCHKQPSRLFSESVQELKDMIHWWHYFLSDLHQELPQLKVVFTLSPFRYAKYGMHESQLGKARLLLLIEEMQREFGCFVSYFPAYEIVCDELRDYRFYDSDMLHPSQQATDYVWERFRSWAFTPELSAYADERTALLRAFAHRPINPHSEAHQAFLQKLEAKKQAFMQKYGEEGLEF